MNRFEIKIAIVTFVGAVICAVVDWHLSGSTNAAMLVAPLITAAAAGGSAFFFGRRPMARLINAKKLQRPVQVPDDFAAYGKAMDEIVATNVSPLKSELTTLRADLQDYVTKEMEFNLVARIDDQLHNVHVTDEALTRMISAIHEELQEFITCAFAFRQASREELSVASSIGIDPSHKKAVLATVSRSAPAIAASPTPIIWNKADLTQLAMVIPASTERVVLVPLKTSNTHQFIGCLMLCLNTPQERLISRVVRMMKKVSEHASRLLYRIAQAEEKEESRRRDKLTQAWTRAVLSEKLMELTSADRNSNLSLLLIEGDNFVQLNQTIGRERGDELI
ncbi:MAG TPA: diguanylate cyclase, partial [Candidatus Obscuribacterales bacterium]